MRFQYSLLFKKRDEQLKKKIITFKLDYSL